MTNIDKLFQDSPEPPGSPSEPRRTRSQTNRRKPKKPLLKSARFWVPISILLVLIIVAAVVAIVAALMVPRVFATRDALSEAIPLAGKVQEQILDNDTEGAQATAARLAELTAEAREQSDDDLWRRLEIVPVAGPNLNAVRLTAESVDDLVTDLITPLSTLGLGALAPEDGRVDVEGLYDLIALVDDAAGTTDRIFTQIDSINRDGVIDQVTEALDKVDKTLGDIHELLPELQKYLRVIPPAVGAEAPRNYLMLFQNNAESRGTGGNPASIVHITADNGYLDLADQASSHDFYNSSFRYTTTDLDQATLDLYGAKVGQYVQDTTMTPDFTESARLVTSFWNESFGTPIDGIISTDPVALSYILEATGPVMLPDGTELTSDNAVSLLMNEVYYMYPNAYQQDAFFSDAAAAVFRALASGQGEMKHMLQQLARAVDEGRLLYVPATEEEAALIEGTRITGQLPVDNVEQTMMGVYVNDDTEGKLDYYVDMSIDAQSTQCEAPDAPQFVTTVDFTNTLQPGEQWELPEYISPGRWFPKGTISTNMVFYGPIGSTFESVTVNGEQTWETTVVEHLGRPAVKVRFENAPGVHNQIQAVFTGGAVEGGYGPLEIWHTPMVRDVPVTETPACG